MNVAFYSFSKRRNSTKQPTGTGTVKDCKLKDNCSVHDPVLTSASNTSSYNYAYIATWGRYYFITDTVYLANNLVEYHLTEDVLASNKTAIGGTYAYIAFSSTYSDNKIIDSRLQTLPTYSTIPTVKNLNIFGVDRYLLTVFNNKSVSTDAGGMGMVYYCQPVYISALKAALASAAVMDDLSDYFHGNPLGGLLSLKWIPYTCAGAAGTEAGGFTIGNKYINIGYDPQYMTSYYIKTGTVSFDASTTYTDFRSMDPFTKGTLFLPGVGTIPINVNDYMFGGGKIYVEYALEEITGDITYMIKDGLGAIHATASANVAADLPVGQIVGNPSGVVGSIGATAGSAVGLIAGIATGNAAVAGASALGFLGSAANLALNSNQHSATAMGGIGSRGIKVFKDVVYTEFAIDTMSPTVSNYVNTKGRPVCQVDRISDHPGFVQCIDASVELSASEQEIREVNDFLNSGIYYE